MASAVAGVFRFVFGCAAVVCLAGAVLAAAPYDAVLAIGFAVSAAATVSLAGEED